MSDNLLAKNWYKQRVHDTEHHHQVLNNENQLRKTKIQLVFH